MGLLSRSLSSRLIPRFNPTLGLTKARRISMGALSRFTIAFLNQSVDRNAHPANVLFKQALKLRLVVKKKLYFLATNC